MEEIWMPVIKYLKRGKGIALYNFYYVSNLGNIKGHVYHFKKFDENVIQIINGRRCMGWKPIYAMVDRLFRGPVPEGYVVHHSDFNKLNDNLDNLVRVTPSEHCAIHSSKRKGMPFTEKHKKNMKGINKGKKPRLGMHNTEHSKELMRNKIWITNGIINKRINNYEEIPEGFRKGKIQHKNKK